MEDQKRILLAVALLLVIFLGMTSLREKLAPPPEPVPATAAEGAPAPVPAPADGQAAAPGVPAQVRQGEATPPPSPAPEETASFETPLFSGQISSGPGLAAFLLRGYREDRDEDQQLEPVSLVTAAVDGAVRQALVRIDAGGAPLAGLAFTTRGENRFVVSGTSPSGLRATVVVAVRPDAYALDYEVLLENQGTAALRSTATIAMGLSPHPGASEGSMFSPPADLITGFCARDAAVERWTADDVEDGAEVRPGTHWAGLDRQYFVVAAIAQEGGGDCRVSARDKSVFVEFSLGAAELGPGASWRKQAIVYLGPKRNGDLEKVAAVLNNIIDYNVWKIPLGFLARPMVAVMSVFHGWTGSWGLAIILLTFVVKLILFPVTYKSSISMRRMQLVKPELDKIKARYGNDRERVQLEQMKLFREKGVNPLGGCLPMLLQMPVWFALWRTLWTSVDLYQQSFLWLDNLTAKESFPYLSIVLGALTMLQQKLMPTTMDSQQAKIMMYVMPAVFTLFMIGLPSGLVLYIVVNSILTIIQQLVINRRQVTL